MLHSEIENEEIVERYVRRQLTPDARQAFEEHFFACDECFEKVQTAERFVAGISDAADAGLLDHEPRAAFGRGPGTWLTWALAATACAALVIAAATGWIYLTQVPKLRRELGRTAGQLQAERQSRANREQVPVELAEANVPLVMLQASRADEEPASVTLQPGAKRLILWIEIGASRYRKFRLEILSQQNRLVASVTNLERGPYGALAASLPADQLPAGDFRIILSGQEPPPASLGGEYRLRIRRP